MEQGNAKLLAASAVVVALVLVFSYVTLAGDDDAIPEFRTEPAIGDYIAVEYRLDDGTYIGTAEYRVVSIWDGGLEMEFDGERSVMTPEEYVGILNEYHGEPAGTETIDTIHGKLECTLYRTVVSGYDTVLYVHGGIIYMSATDGGYGSLVASSLFGPAPEFPAEPVTPGVGDWMACHVTAERDGAVLYEYDSLETVVAEEDGMLTVEYDEDGETGQRTQSVLSFMTSIGEGISPEAVGQELVAYGGEERLTTVYKAVDGATGNTLVVHVDGTGVALTVKADYGSHAVTIVLTGTSMI